MVRNVWLPPTYSHQKNKATLEGNAGKSSNCHEAIRDVHMEFDWYNNPGWKVICADLAKIGIVDARFAGTREQCLNYMRTHRNVDLIDPNGRFSTWSL